MRTIPISQFHLLHMIGHLLGANVVDILLAVFCQVYAFVDALLELALIELHLEHVDVHLLLLAFDALVVLGKCVVLEAFDLLFLLGTQEPLSNFSVHELEPEYFCR